MKERKYKKWLPNYSNRHNKSFKGIERYNLTWIQIKEIIDEEIKILKKQLMEVK